MHTIAAEDNYVGSLLLISLCFQNDKYDAMHFPMYSNDGITYSIEGY